MEGMDGSTLPESDSTADGTSDGTDGSSAGGDEGDQPEPESDNEADEEVEWEYYGNCRITFYCHCEICNGTAGNPTASGAYPTAWYTVASGPDIPFGTEVMIGGNVYVVEDRGVDCGQFDIFVPDHQTALECGLYYEDVFVRG